MNKVIVGNKIPLQYDAASLVRLMREVENAISQTADGFVHNTTAVSAGYTCTLADSIIVVDTSGGAKNLTLPRADQAKNKRFTVKSTSTNNVLVSASSGNVETAGTYTVSGTRAFASFVSDGTNYWAV